MIVSCIECVKEIKKERKKLQNIRENNVGMTEKYSIEFI